MLNPIIIQSQMELLSEARNTTFEIFNTMLESEQQDKEDLQYATEHLLAVIFRLRNRLDALKATPVSL